MSHSFTKRNHYNPCFWVAYWNEEYFRAATASTETKLKPRDQTIFTLNIRANKVVRTTVDNVHFDKGLGIAEIAPDSMKDFCKRRFPSEYDEFCKNLGENPEILYHDFEDILTGVEKVGGYSSLIEAVKRGGLSSVEHKGFLTCLLVIHVLRSHEVMQSMIEFSGIKRMPKWEYFWLLKNAWSNKLVLARAVTPLAFSQWVLYQVEQPRFPLCDSPVIVGRNNIMVILSPRLLLEINLNVPWPEDHWIERSGISNSKFREFRRRAISNTFKEIVFSSSEELETWRRLPEFKTRVALLNDSAGNRTAIKEATLRAMWVIDGFGRLPHDFEKKISHVFNA